MAAPPVRDDRRIVLHLDYDCFYASVFEVEQPALKSQPLAVQQKQIVVTCNYEARRRGLHKLQLIKDAKRICPEVVIVLGEDLTKFRDASKDIYHFIRGFIWGGRVERLGFDELSLDVTEMVDYNMDLLNRSNMESSFFHLDKSDPTIGFTYDATGFHGFTIPPQTGESSGPANEISRLGVRLLIGSHLLSHLRSKLEYEKGFTATGGVSTSKLLAKLVGSVHKPNQQTTLVPPYEMAHDGSESNVIRFIDSHEIQKIPGIGSRLAQKLRARVTGRDIGEGKVTVRDVRLHPNMGPPLLEKTLGGPGAAKGSDLPSQISIEDTYGRGRLDSMENVRRELTVLTKSLLRRMRADLVDRGDANAEKPRWLAHPRTLRLSTRPRNAPETDGIRTYNSNRISRSAPLPSFVFNLDENLDSLAERIVQDHAMGMFRKLHTEKSGWDLGLMNIAVTNMVESAGDQKQSSGRDIGKMFRQQETVLREWTVYESDDPPTLTPDVHVDEQCGWQDEDGDEDQDAPLLSIECSICGAPIPHFAQQAHALYHVSEEN
ncbi:uncharacterized protein N7469_010501 [Penicillium citrinum]|uniref:UmuC domain-containing protein n=1 Tax=Penicillium citrinum TaxID=5077 RepID=A0A9W9TGK6_PENCI|nr:uncharacterized protein N7469_010501 [Penicillium citrinum]KAJ5221614.1 hypothetical protein N7469_010501 [Penicillium citrinum]